MNPDNMPRPFAPAHSEPEVDISEEAITALVDRLWEYGTVVGKPLSTQDSVCHNAAEVVQALRDALTADAKDAARWRHARQFLAVEDVEAWDGEDWTGHYPSEVECRRADEATDRAILAKGDAK